ncbi:MAG: M20/M25/M40 family metallo-hydrolase [Bryobacteraceae bacterium]|nr:M20/M25/M40 family metallo-hydrolase [Bryobacteraceae bacterium]
MKRVGQALAAAALLLAAFVGVAAFRAATLRSRQVASRGPLVAVDASRAPDRLAEAIRIRTVSREDGEVDRVEFLRFHEWLASAYPKVHAALERETVNELSLLYEWRGEDPSLAPALLLAHIDVVPAESDAGWKHPPFEGRIEGGEVWGRGALDDKASLVALMEAAESLLGHGFRSRRTLYFAFGHDEEVGGRRGARAIADLLARRGVKPEFVLDEGGALTRGLVEGVTAPVAAVAVAEKGVVNVELTVSGAGGHSSAPPQATAAGKLARAVARIEANPMPARLTAPVKATFDYIAPEAPFLQRLAAGNLWVSAPLVLRFMQRSDTGNAQTRTTCVATILEAGTKSNVIPATARAVVNCRLLPGDTVAGVARHLREAIGDPDVQVRAPEVHSEPPPPSDFDSPAAQWLKQSIAETIPGAILAPVLTTGATDSRHYARLTRNIYRFAPITATAETLRLAHGVNERISAGDYRRAVQFYAQLISNAGR